MSTDEDKRKQLGMPIGTASGKLRKMVLFHQLKKHHENFCFRCGAEIETVNDLSIDHKKPWLHENTDLFWNMENVAFSHLNCNSGATRTRPRVLVHNTCRGYSYGCRCDGCRHAATTARQEDRINKRNGV